MPSAISPTRPLEFYKFRSFGAPDRMGEDKKRLADLLQGRLWFSNIASFNDPFEGRPHFVPAFDNAAKQREAIKKYMRDIALANGKSRAEARQISENFVSGRTQQEIVDAVGESVLPSMTSDGILVYSVSGPEALSTPLAWSHYADQHRGVCIHFDATAFPFASALPIKYSESYPTLTVPRTYQDPWEAVERALFTKSHLWSYEQEFRMVKVKGSSRYRHPVAEKLGVTWEGNVAIAPPAAVIGITVGARMEKPIRDELRALVKIHAPHLELWRASLHKSRFEIVRER